MGEWTHITGKINAKKVSAKKAIEGVLRGEDFVINYDKNTFTGRFQQSGRVAAKTIAEIIDAVKKINPKAVVLIQAEITFRHN